MNTLYFILAVAATSAGIFALTTRADRISDRIVRRRASSDGGSYDPGASSGSASWSAATWWFGAHSGQLTDSSLGSDSGGSWSSGDSGGSDAGGGGGSSD